MFRAQWTWCVPLAAAAAVFGLVLATTPPGFGAISDVVFATLRGPNADAAAYALGAAASLALVVLLVLAAACGALELALRRPG
jgi:hypothetical protein